MLLKVRHETRYTYDAPLGYALQRLRLTPKSGRTQTVVSWAVEIEGAEEQVRFTDHFGNETQLVSVTGGPNTIGFTASGEVETHDTTGVVGAHDGFTPLWLYLHETGLTEAGPLVKDLSQEVGSGGELETLHALMDAVAGRVTYLIGATGSATTAEAALAQGQGVCQDHAHIFIAAARSLGMPARYVSGYLMMDEGGDQAASHAWAEAHVTGLGWVGFDVSNAMSPDGRYVRLAVGRDYRDAMPISGIRLGPAQEQLAVHITVEQ